MPRKVSYGIDRDDDYDDYEDYEYDYEDEYDYPVEENGVAFETKQNKEANKTGVWRCHICTFDNEDSMSACDICGVLRYPLVKGSNTRNNDDAGGICKEFGASIMAKSLFASVPNQNLQKSFEAQIGVFKPEDCFNIHKLGNFRGHFHDLTRAFICKNHYKHNIAPFKFNVPSPDDLVSTGKVSSKLNSRDDSKNLFSDEAPMKEKTVDIDLTIGRPDSSAASISGTGLHDDGKNNSFQDIENETQGLPSKIRDISISTKTGNPKNSEGLKKALLNSEFKPEKWMLPDLTDNPISQLNLAIVGHVDSGKSTLSGRLLHLFGRISQKEFHRNEKEAKQQGKGSFAYAWALDESVEERERGITMTVGVAYFSTKRYKVVLLDSPGHRDFVPNMISGATQADAAILVIDASMGSFEAGIDVNGGQTREHAQLIRSFGVDQIIIAVNKMDVVGYSKDRFETIKKQLGTFLRSCGFKDSSVLWIPISTIENQNLVSDPSDERLSWSRGLCLIDAIDSLQPPVRELSKPLVMPICDVIKSTSQGQVSACGKLETGALRSGYKVLLMPSREIATVRSLERDSEACKVARAGDNVTVSLQGIEGNRVTAGGVLCHPDFPIAVANHLELKILVLDTPTPILIGSQLECHIHHAKEAARVVKIVALLDPKTGNVSKKSPRILLAKQNAIVEVILQEMICVEDYSSCRALGRVSLRSSGRTVALGVVSRVIVANE
ncbi:hypothetical protein Leryth_009395 [Lithospermum erythrorhizon]|nr:hypothetical protein Leryth_009395 [Lithospermum erythrorhizon]